MMKTMKVKKKLNSRKKLLRAEKLLKKKLEKEADSEWHKAVIRKYGNRCSFVSNSKRAEHCQRITKTCHHYFAKGRYPELRYVIDNGVPVCWNCHYKAEKIDRTMLSDILLLRGEAWYSDLLKKSQERKGSFQTIDYYKEVIEELKRSESN